MAIIPEPQRSQLYTKVRHLLGASIRSVELTDEMFDSLMDFAIQDYGAYIQNWLIESQWTALYGLDIDTQSLANAFITRSLNWETRFTYAYSKIVNLQANGPYVAEKDFVQLEHNQQIYSIPAGREVVEVLWFAPAELNNALFDPWNFGGLGAGGLGGAGGFAQMGSGGSYMMMPAFDILLRMQETNIQRRIIAGDLTYKMTALPDGSRALHLMNTPGGKFDFGNATLMKGKVWYWYYDTTPGPDGKCLDPNIINTPMDVPFDALNWVDLNNPAQQWVRRWFVAYAKETLGRIRGKFSGALMVPDVNVTMDYQSLLTEGKDEKSKLIDELLGQNGILTRLLPENVMAREANIAENLNKQLKFRATPRQIYVI